MARTITVDPAKLETVSQKIEAATSDYERQYRQLFTEVDGLGAAWQGIDNMAFVNQIKGFQEDFQTMTTLMKQYSEFLKTSAKTYKETQNETINQAKRLAN